MRVIKIKKRSGGERIIYAPSPEEKLKFKTLLGEIRPPLSLLEHAHAFLPNRNIVTNALPHIGKRVTISFDIEKFFDSVKPEMVAKFVPVKVIRECFIDGAPRQGLPTSPMIANIAATALDKAIVKALYKEFPPGEVVYTRYADDISISVDTHLQLHKVVDIVKDCVCRCGFSLNERKTKIQFARKGRREICGVMVDDTGVHISRKTRRYIRAVRYYLRKVLTGRIQVPDVEKDQLIERLTNKLAGLLEFSMLKLPNKGRKEPPLKQKYQEARTIAKAFGLRPPQMVQKAIPEQKLEEGYYITNDPVYFYGMSEFTDNWTSCMRLAKGSRSRGVVFWQRHPGVSIAYKESDLVVSVAGVRRPAMAARALVYALRNGLQVFGRVYGKSMDDRQDLMNVLERHGFKNIESLGCCKDTPKEGLLVVGNVSHRLAKPYFDNCILEKVKVGEKTKCRLKIRTTR